MCTGMRIDTYVVVPTQTRMNMCTDMNIDKHTGVCMDICTMCIFIEACHERSGACVGSIDGVIVGESLGAIVTRGTVGDSVGTLPYQVRHESHITYATTWPNKTYL